MAQKTKKRSKKKSTSVTAPITSPPTDVAKSSRTIKPTPYKSFRLQKKVTVATPRLKGGFRLLGDALDLVLKNWKPILGMLLIFAAANLVLVQSFSNINLTDIKRSLETGFEGNAGQLVGSISLFAYLVSTAGSSNSEAAGVYRFVLLIIITLALIWTVRHLAGGKSIRVRDGYYFGMTPLVPFLVVLVAVGFQLLPIGIGAYLYGLVGQSGFAIGGTEWLIWAVTLFMLTVLTLYMLASSIFALYIVCLPGMQPMAALRSARELVRYRRWTVIRRILFLPFMLVLAGALIMIPIILFITPIAVWVFFTLTVLSLPIAISYIYRLYWELLREE